MFPYQKPSLPGKASLAEGASSYKGTAALLLRGPLPKQDSPGAPPLGCLLLIPSLARALHGWPFLPLLCCFTLGLGLGLPCPPSDWPQTVLGSGLHLVLCPPTAAKHCAVSPNLSTEPQPEQPSFQGHLRDTQHHSCVTKAQPRWVSLSPSLMGVWPPG